MAFPHFCRPRRDRHCL